MHKCKKAPLGLRLPWYILLLRAEYCVHCGSLVVFVKGRWGGVRVSILFLWISIKMLSSRPLFRLWMFIFVAIYLLFRPLLTNTTYLKLYNKFLFKEKPIWSLSGKYRKKVQPTSLLESYYRQKFFKYFGRVINY